MPIVLYRVDERLIHGQVVVGWGTQLRPQRYLVVDAALAQSEWEQELYILGVPEGAEASFVSPPTAREELSDWRSSSQRCILLTPDVETMLALARGGLLEGEDVNLGGIHLRKGREQVLSYIYLDDNDRALLRELEAEGVRVTAQDLPGSPKVSLEALLG
jgi:mannose/fructose/N-acetylgalactosamine-specific phosphotransferase system component IIB